MGYRVNYRRATKFRIWATSILKEYMIKGCKEKAEVEYDEFNRTQKIISDFDRAVEKMLEGGENNEQA